jgi:cellulose biosynthesis protein BcsQ
MSIITFYSYKGGVGRSMALANIAFQLAKGGKKVLMIDWDLEAPGLERYFTSFIKSSEGNGLLPLLLEVSIGHSPDYRDYLWTIDISATNPIALLQSGRAKDPDYSKNLEGLDWNHFFSDDGGGAFLEAFRERINQDFDLVLIDSRTGLSDSSGICTIFLPDIVVPMFTANYQSLSGVRDIMRLVQDARQKLDVDRLPLTILPIPTRFGTRAEFKESQEWLNRFAEELNEFYNDWLPKWIQPRQVLELVKIPQVDYFSFGEKLAVVEQGVSDPEGMGFIYSKIASLLASDFKDIDAFMGPGFQTQKETYEAQKQARTKNLSPSADYEYDIYISYSPDAISTEWLSETFLPLFTGYLSSQSSAPPAKIFFNRAELSPGESWSSTLKEALIHSKILMPIINLKYLRSAWALAELLTFKKRSAYTQADLIVPVLTSRSQETSHPLIDVIQHVDFSDFLITGKDFSKDVRYLEFLKLIQQLASDVSQLLEKVPPFDPSWPVADLVEANRLTIKASSKIPRLK